MREKSGIIATEHRRRPRMLHGGVAVLVAGSLALVGCSDSHKTDSRPPETLVAPGSELPPSSTSTSTIPPTTEASTTSPTTEPSISPFTENTACIRPYVPVFPDSHYKPSNVDDMRKQLDALQVAHDTNAKVTLDTIINAGSIVVDSLTDPAYAEAFTYANQHSGTVTAEGLLAMHFNAGDGGCLQHEQIQAAGQLYDTLVDGLAPKAGRQISAAARAAYDGLKTGYHSFQQTYHDELSG